VDEHTLAGAGWPALKVADWASTREALHMYTQIVGKIRLAHLPLINHWWQAPLYVSARGLTTSTIPYGTDAFDIEFDFHDHQLVIRTSKGTTGRVALEPKSVADFYAETLGTLAELGVQTAISARPNEVDPAIPFPQDTVRRPYDAASVTLFWRQLIQADRVLRIFRSHFLGKVSPVHFFWGSFDMACTRFSGRTAPAHPGGAPHCPDWVMVEGYSHELSSCGFWPGDRRFPHAAFYAYSAPVPPGLEKEPVRPAPAAWDSQLGEFIFKYEDAREIALKDDASPDQAVLDFCQSAYEAGAKLAQWDRTSLERQ